MPLLLKKLWIGEEAQGLSEYALLFMLIALTVVTAMGGLAASVDNVYSEASSRVSAAANSPSFAGGTAGITTQSPDKKQDKLNRDKSSLRIGSAKQQ